MDNKRRRLEILGEVTRIPLLIHLRVGVRSALKLPVIEPEFLCSPPCGDGVKHAVVRNDALKTVSVAEYPVRHVSSIAGSQRALAVFVDEWISFLGVVEALHQVFKRSAAPVAVD